MKIGNDLKISLSPSMIAPVERWVAHMSSGDFHLFSTPEVKNGILHIHPQDIVDLVAHFADASESNEFDVHRLKALAAAELKRAIARKRAEDVKRAYEGSLKMLMGTKPFQAPYPSLLQTNTGF